MNPGLVVALAKFSTFLGCLVRKGGKLSCFVPCNRKDLMSFRLHGWWREVY